MLEIKDYQQVNLGSVERLFLVMITEGYSSAYSLFSYLKSADDRKPMAYKNVNKRVKRLEQLNLIEFERKFKRNAKHYKLTTKGLLYIISNHIAYDSGLFTKYKNNIILQTLLFPYFEFETIKKCRGHLYLLVSQYLRECYSIIFNACSRLGDTEVYTTVMLRYQERYRLPFNPFAKWIEDILEWHAKSFAVKLSLKYLQKYPRIIPAHDGSVCIGLSDAPSETVARNILSRDRKFMKFLETVAQDFEAGYKDLLQRKDQGN